MTPFQFILASLCCYRLTVLFSRDEVTKPLRKLPYVGHVIGCPFCVAIWLAAGIELAFIFSGVTDLFVVEAAIVFALAAVSLILDRCFSSDHQA